MQTVDRRTKWLIPAVCPASRKFFVACKLNRIEHEMEAVGLKAILHEMEAAILLGLRMHMHVVGLFAWAAWMHGC
jgi:hypothetical protein